MTPKEPKNGNQDKDSNKDSDESQQNGGNSSSSSEESTWPTPDTGGRLVSKSENHGRDSEMGEDD